MPQQYSKYDIECPSLVRDYIVDIKIIIFICVTKTRTKKKKTGLSISVYIVIIGVDVTMDKNQRDMEWTKNDMMTR